MKDNNTQQLTALILTLNEEDNIERVLNKLRWLEKIIIVDSGSTDKTINIIKNFTNTEIYVRNFDNFADQCNYGVSLITTQWVLSLDADYVLTDELVEELKIFFLTNKNENIVACEVEFNFCVFGKPLSANNTTPRAVLFKKNLSIYYNDGHAHRLKINGEIKRFKYKINHDDRKPLSRWLANQDKYSVQESDKLFSSSKQQLNFTSKLRRFKILAPVFIFLHCLFIKGMIFNGWRGWHYTLQRTIAEALISLRLTEKKF